ncbi:glycine receptor subunit alpha-2-like [Lineus longissimus]|uniref:glycine receptor subunit alpha-2-like n=1 Tax=Lineus longissimus TaxID=88925 RepID=UPI00315D5BC6
MMFILPGLVIACFCTGNGEASQVSEIMIDELLSSYNKTVRPDSLLGKPTTIQAQFHVNSITSISDKTMDYNIDIFFRQKWRDHRLAFNKSYGDSVSLGFHRMNQMWRPDTVFLNAKSGYHHHLTVPNDLLTLHPDGVLLISQRLSLILSCNMHLYYYPMDNQRCSVVIGSFGYSSRDLMYDFMSDNSITYEEDMLLPEFIIDKEHVEQHAELILYSTGNFSVLRFVFPMERDIGTYIIQTYIPSILIVVLSWVNFWLDINATPARISLGLITVLTITTQSSGLHTRLPKVSYIKAIDVWMSTCLVFVFGALLEFAVANVMTRKIEKKAKKKAAAFDHVLANPSVLTAGNLRKNDNGNLSRVDTDVEMADSQTYQRRDKFRFPPKNNKAKTPAEKFVENK